MTVTITNIPPIRVAFRRHVGPYSEVGETWDRLLPVLGKDGLIGGDAMFIGICHDDPEVTPRDKIRYDACVSIDAAFVSSGDIGVQVIARSARPRALRELLLGKSILFKGVTEKLKEEIYRALRNYPVRDIRDLIEAGLQSRNEYIREESARLSRSVEE